MPRYVIMRVAHTSHRYGAVAPRGNAMLEASKFADGAYRTGAKLLLAATAMAASMLTLAGGAQAGSVTYSGVLTDTPTYHRPSYTNAFTPAFNCTNCGFQSEAVSVSLSGAYTFSILSSSFPDQVNMLYTDSFDPGSPFTNLVSP